MFRSRHDGPNTNLRYQAVSAVCGFEASGDFAKKQTYHLEVQIPDEGMKKIPEEKRKVVMQILSQDPRPSYQNDPERVYGMGFAGFEVKFRVEGSTLYVVSVTKKEKE